MLLYYLRGDLWLRKQWRCSPGQGDPMVRGVGFDWRTGEALPHSTFHQMSLLLPLHYVISMPKQGFYYLIVVATS